MQLRDEGFCGRDRAAFYVIEIHVATRIAIIASNSSVLP